MSAINVFRYADGIVMLTDGAVMRPDGALAFLMPKVSIFPHLQAVCAFRGIPRLGKEWATFAAAFFSDFDDIVDRIELAFLAFCEMNKAIINSSPEAALADVVFAGWSRRDACAGGFMIANHDDMGFPPFELQPLRDWLIMPLDQGVQANIEALMGGPLGSVQMDADHDGISIMEAQRQAMTEQDGERRPLYNVGGFIQATTVTGDGIEARIIKRWPDKAGERLNLAAPSAPPPARPRSRFPVISMGAAGTRH